MDINMWRCAGRPRPALTVGVGQVELGPGALLKHVVRRHVALEGHQAAAAPARQQAHTAVENGLHRVSVGG